MRGKEVVIVVDMINDFCAEGGALYSPLHSRIIPEMLEFLREKASQGVPLIFASDWHEQDFDKDPESRWFQVPHAVKGSWGAEIVKELAPLASGGICVKKFAPDAFLKSELGELMEELSPEKITIVGVCTDICVEATACTARYLGYEVEIPERLVATFHRVCEGLPPHPGDESHQEAIRRLRDTFGVKIV